MKTLIYLLIVYTPLSISTSHAQWIKYNAYNQTSLEISDIQFLNINTGYAVGAFPDDTVFLKTTNGGVNWIRLFINADTSYIGFYTAIYFTNENTGFLCGGGRYIHKTINGGLNWIGYPAPFRTITSTYNDLYFVNQNTGFAVGRYGLVSKTTNGGLTWDSIYMAMNDLHCIQFVNSNTGFMADVSSYFYKTTNAGNTWWSIRAVDSIGFGYGYQSISFLNENTGFITGYLGANIRIVLKTINGGLNWQTVFQGNGHFYNINFPNVNTGYVFGGNTGGNNAYKTTNSGDTWSLLNIDAINYKAYTSYFFDALSGFVGSNGGNVYKTTTGGVGINYISNTLPLTFRIRNPYPNPFNSQVNIEFEVPNEVLNLGNKFLINVYDIKGSLISETKYDINSPGTYKLNLNFNNLNSGIYFLKINNAYRITETIKIMLIK